MAPTLGAGRGHLGALRARLDPPRRDRGHGPGGDPRPQGMAYAELAGLPAVTGLYTTIACLVAYAVFGPSKVLVLGPDSSVSPLILATITPLVVTDDPGSALVLAGMLAVLVGLIEMGLRGGEAGLRGGPALQRGARRLPERARGDDHRGSAAEAVRVLHRRRRVRR
ncbi:MAG: SulP family inorganic anion transporter [Microthrixaceae bacterium]|nr:SulP family inorganic anion transporter [Microthrixaceae bacterium]